MPPVPDVLTTAQAIIDQHALRLMTAPRLLPLAPPRRRPGMLQRVLSLLRVLCTPRHERAWRGMPLDVRRQTLLHERAARIDPYLYILATSA
jgi:hypothetical protein